MGASRTLLRKLDLDLIARMEASGRIEKKQKAKRGKPPRQASKYRGARRNAQRGQVWRNSFSDQQRQDVCHDGSFGGAIKLNRSRRWPRAKSYAHAREIGPSSEIVR